MFIKLFITLVHPLLEYSNVVWGPFFLNQRKKSNTGLRAYHQYLDTGPMGR